MKILISVQVRWWNASAYYAISVAEALQKMDHEVTVLAHSSTPAYQKALDLGLTVVDDINPAEKNPLKLLREIGKLYDFVKTGQFDILNAHRPEDHIALALAQKRLKEPGILVRTITDVRSPQNNPINKILHESWTAGLIYCANVCRPRYQRVFKLKEKPETVIHSGLDVSSFAAGDWVKDNPYLQYSSPRIGVVARLSPNKGHKVLIKAAVKILEKFPNASFLIIGKEEEVKTSDLEEYTASLNVTEAFHFTGKLDDPRPAMAALDFGLVTSTESEVISRAAQELFALGKPVIATKVNVLPEMIDEGANGILVDPGNADQLADAVINLAGNPEAMKAMGERAATYAVRRHDLSVLGRATETFFKYLTGAFS